jgi:hypothetical protein
MSSTLIDDSGMSTLYTEGTSWVDRKAYILMREDRARLLEENAELDAVVQGLRDLVDYKDGRIMELETAIEHLSQEAAGEDI